MNLKIRNVDKFKEVILEDGAICIDMGFLNESDMRELAVHLVSSAWDLCPTKVWKPQKWMESILNELNIDIPVSETEQD